VAAPATRLSTELASATHSATSVEVDVTGDSGASAAAVRAVGGRVRASVKGALTATVPGTKLAALAASAGVDRVAKPIHPTEQAVSEGVGLSNATAWQTAGFTGKNVKVAIIDAAFGSLPSGIAVHETDYCAQPTSDQHGSAVAEIVHEMAPDAQLYLYCVDTPVEVNTAEQAILALGGVKVISMSLGWDGDSRGDGTDGSGDGTSVAHAIQDARQHGILFVDAAGNSAQDHWSGTFADTDKDHYADLDGVGYANEDDLVRVGHNSGASVTLQWDQWPTSNLDVELVLFESECNNNTSCDNPTPLNGGNPYVAEQAPGTNPVLDPDISDSFNLDVIWDIYVLVPSSQPSIRFDLTFDGAVYPSYRATYGDAAHAARAAAGSIDEDAASPYAMAVGAVDASPLAGTNNDPCFGGSSATTGLPFELYSSQGPTIDGRYKPDILGYDGTASSVYGQAFCGTSAAAPHVAGAAALVAQADPSLDASQLEDALEQRADHGSPINPADNALGHGVLTLGNPAGGVTAPSGSGFTPLPSPVRVLDTRNGTGSAGHVAPIAGGQNISITIPNTVVPADATAVAINVTGVLPAHSGPAFLGIFPGGRTYPNTSNVNLAAPYDTIAAASTIVALGAGGVVQVHAGAHSTDAVLDVTGYFTAGSGSKYTAEATPFRAYDGRNVSGGDLSTDHSVVIHPNLPVGATAALINLTATGQTAPGFFNAAPTPSTSSSSLNFTPKINRANMAIVGLASDGTFTVSDHAGSAFPIVDVVGYFSPTGASSFVPLASPVRIVDTRNGDGGRKAALTAGLVDPIYAGGLNSVPYSATAVVTGVTAVDHSGSTFLTAYPAGITRPNTSTVNVTAGRIVPNGATVGFGTGSGADSLAVYNLTGSTDLIVDLFGYFA
jgi:subtilisin family serine protease